MAVAGMVEGNGQSLGRREGKPLLCWTLNRQSRTLIAMSGAPSARKFEAISASENLLPSCLDRSIGVRFRFQRLEADSRLRKAFGRRQRSLRCAARVLGGAGSIGAVDNARERGVKGGLQMHATPGC